MGDTTVGNSSAENAVVNGEASLDKTTKSLEQRYIELLEEKIARLQVENSSLKDGSQQHSKTPVSISYDVLLILSCDGAGSLRCYPF